MRRLSSEIVDCGLLDLRYLIRSEKKKKKSAVSTGNEVTGHRLSHVTIALTASVRLVTPLD
jgi:hypothetical protein